MRLGGTAYPRVALDFQGSTGRLPAPAKRIATLSDHIDETCVNSAREPHGEPRIFAVSMTSFSYGGHTLFQQNN